MHCPYPTAEEAARALRCGEGETCGAGSAARVEVVGFALDTSTVSRINDIAVAGGAEKARFAASGESLRRELSAILDEIVAAH
jgi:hypothetical protein